MSDVNQQALDLHEKAQGKLSVVSKVPLKEPFDLTLAYTPGVAAPCLAIKDDPAAAYKYTTKGNMVAVVTNGSAVLGLGNIGAMAGLPVMEGKAILFKGFAGVDSVPVCLDTQDPQEIIRAVELIAPTYGGINLEDIKAPQCFDIENALKKSLNIPVFHDDQHGTAIVTTAGILNAVELQGKKIEDCKVVCVGAGAAGIACSDFLIKCGAKKENFFMIDRHGVIRSDRPQYNNGEKPRFINDAGPKTLEEAMKDADVLLGVSGPGLVTEEDVKEMAPNAVIFACSNPDPEVDPAVVRRLRPDIIIGTGRSDYPNQINNVLCFPYLFRGALDVRATCINDEMTKAAMGALRAIAHEPVPAAVCKAAGVDHLEFGPDYVIPKPMDPRLLKQVSRAVAEAAVKSGVAKFPLPENYMQD